MMRHTILKVGELRAAPLRQASEEYRGRIRSYAKVEIESVSAERIPPDPSAAERENVLRAEGQRLCRAAPRGPAVQWIALDERGRQMDSPSLARYLRDAAARGTSHMVWFIGGALGLSDRLIERSSLRFSLSRLTFPHQMVPMILLEQIYRSCRIQRGEPYHY